MKEFIASLDPKTARTVTVVCVVFVFLFGVVAYIGHNSYAPIIIDKTFGISAYVSDSVSRRIGAEYEPRFLPAGFPATFTYDDMSGEAGKGGQSLIFYAPADTQVELWILGSGHYLQQAPAAASPIRFQLQVDEAKVAVRHNEIPGQVNLRLDRFLTSDIEGTMGKGFHTLSVVPLPHPYKMLITIDCLVLVTKGAPKQ